jgi:hypothetical protein
MASQEQKTQKRTGSSNPLRSTNESARTAGPIHVFLRLNATGPHQLGRIGYGVELDPGYVAVALERLSEAPWADTFGWAAPARLKIEETEGID